MAKAPKRDLVERLRAGCTDWDGSQMAAETQPMDCLSVGDVREAADEIDRLRAVLTELLACQTESAGWSMSMLANRAEFDAMLERSQARLESAVVAAREALGPNVPHEPHSAAQEKQR